jgi:hypothetical protein
MPNLLQHITELRLAILASAGLAVVGALLVCILVVLGAPPYVIVPAAIEPGIVIAIPGRAIHGSPLSWRLVHSCYGDLC